MANQPIIRPRCFWLVFLAAVLFAETNAPVVAQQVAPNNAATQTIDPVRVGDKVEVRGVVSGWTPATVLSVEDGKAEVEMAVGNSTVKRDYSVSRIRFPNGEGQWAIWKNKSGKLEVAGRYIARDEKEVMIRTADGKELTIPIKDLALNLKMHLGDYGSSPMASAFSHFRQPERIITVSGTPWVQGVEFIYEDKIAWNTNTSTGVPSSFRLSEGETAQGEIQKATQPNYRLFESLKFPKEVIYPKFRNGLGRTSITVNGFVDQLYAEVPEVEEPLEEEESKEEVRATSEDKAVEEVPED